MAANQQLLRCHPNQVAEPINESKFNERKPIVTNEQLASVYRDRIQELRRVPAGQLRPHPQNWRQHPSEQRHAMEHVLSEVGYANALLARECDDGQLELIDGHLRAEISPDQLVPVLILDVDEKEAATILATHDPLTALAEVETELLNSLATEIDINDGPIQKLLSNLLDDSETRVGLTEVANDQSAELNNRFQILVDCQNEDEQRDLLSLFEEKGIVCRALIA